MKPFETQQYFPEVIYIRPDRVIEDLDYNCIDCRSRFKCKPYMIREAMCDMCNKPLYR